MLYTSYFARIGKLPEGTVPVAITVIPPKSYNGLVYQKIAPTYDLLTRWKQEQDEDYYTDYFNRKILSKVSPQEVIDDLKNLTDNAKNIALICYEKPQDFCHRHIVSSWLSAAGFPCEEFKE